jgi:hypothetical protein
MRRLEMLNLLRHKDLKLQRPEENKSSIGERFNRKQERRSVRQLIRSTLQE